MVRSEEDLTSFRRHRVRILLISFRVFPPGTMTLCFHIHLLIQFYELPYDVRREKRLECITVYSSKKFACHHLVAVVDRDGEDRLTDQTS